MFLLMKKLIKFFVATGVASSALLNPAIANDYSEGGYISGGAGFSSIGVAGKLGFGYDFGQFRTELDYWKTGGDAYGSLPVNVDTDTIVGNVIWDIPLSKKFYPSLGLGMGSTHVDVNGGSWWGYKWNVSEWVPTYRVRAALTYELSDRTQLFVQSNGDFFRGQAAGLVNVNSLFGMRFKF